MPAQVATDTRQFIQEYFAGMSGKPKTADLLDRYISYGSLKQHILAFELAFPNYEVVPDQWVVEGDTAAMRGTFHGTHRGEFAGLPPTGRTVSTPLMLFYRVADGRIAQFWMQADMPNLMAQLTS